MNTTFVTFFGFIVQLYIKLAGMVDRFSPRILYEHILENTPDAVLGDFCTEPDL